MFIADFFLFIGLEAVHELSIYLLMMIFYNSKRGLLVNFHAREPLYWKSAVITGWLQSSRTQNSEPGC